MGGRIDGIYANPRVKRLSDLTLNDLLKLTGIWVINGDRGLIIRKSTGQKSVNVIDS